MAELRQLRYFVEVARSGTFTGAARNLHLTQSAVSEQILRLETEYGCRLFFRGGRTVQLTATGELLLSYAEPLLAGFAEVERRIRSLRARERGRLRVGTIAGPLMGWLPALLTDFRRVHPDITLSIGAYSTEQMYAMVAGDELDFAIGHAGRPGIPNADAAQAGGHAPVETVRLANEDLVVVVSCSHRLARAGEIGLADLARETFVVFPSGYVLREVVEEACRRAGFAPHVGLETAQIELIGRFVAAGLGISLVSRTAAACRMPPGIQTVEVTADERPQRVLLAIYQAAQPLPEPLATFRDIVGRGAQAFYRQSAADAGPARAAGAPGPLVSLPAAARNAAAAVASPSPMAALSDLAVATAALTAAAATEPDHRPATPATRTGRTAPEGADLPAPPARPRTAHGTGAPRAARAGGAPRVRHPGPRVRPAEPPAS